MAKFYGEPAFDGKVVRLAFDQPDSAAASAAAGVYTATIKVPAKSILTNIGATAVALWNAGTSAAMIVGDADDPNGFYDAVDMKATDLLAGTSIMMNAAGGVQGAYSTGTLTHWTATYDADARTLSWVITTVGTAPTTGETLCWAQWINVPACNPDGVLPYGSYEAS